jgi:hypothetical protein
MTGAVLQCVVEIQSLVCSNLGSSRQDSQQLAVECRLRHPFFIQSFPALGCAFVRNQAENCAECTDAQWYSGVHANLHFKPLGRRGESRKVDSGQNPLRLVTTIFDSGNSSTANLEFAFSQRVMLRA